MGASGASSGPRPGHSAAAHATDAAALIDACAKRATRAGVFGSVRALPDHRGLECAAASAASPAHYRLTIEPDGRAWVSLVMADRYLSQSIEADLVHTGDKLSDLVRDELIDLGAAIGRQDPGPSVEHFRDEQKLFTFRSPVTPRAAPLDDPAVIERAAQLLLAYQSCFANLGDMSGGDQGHDEANA
ncbi:MAG: hypothetical protein C0475_02000 [Planctomyces sp.]|nr:hypothetical protein [Planctomyces sp.]MBA4039370.1 hypothetical protein [Planctomyces sp.]MBA4120226.1 hypothetical protein [Isosphaera sp.]